MSPCVRIYMKKKKPFNRCLMSDPSKYISIVDRRESEQQNRKKNDFKIQEINT